MIILDLEWNRGFDSTPLQEILQIGAVRVGDLGGPVLDTFNVYIRPSVHKRFDPGARKLPDLEASLTSCLDFAAAMELFRQWCGAETEYASWGGDDFAALAENCAYWQLPPPHAEHVYNFQQAFSALLGTGQQLALWKVVDYCRIPDSFTFHNALNDALYTAVAGMWLTRELLDFKPEHDSVRRASALLTQPDFPRQPRQKVGPLQTPEEVLNARAGRSPLCPLCGKRGCVVRWHFTAPRRGGPASQYYGLFSCPDHGHFLCRMTLTQQENGLWQGRRSVPVITRQLVQEYAAALRGGVHPCKGKRRGRRRRHSPS